MLGSWQGVNGRKKVENSCIAVLSDLYNFLISLF